eukprot:CAMPEP_0118832686 /NCGR_PEP_ID=MMETSP1162-20130426/40015_1 /TAXON_ID=33656 /ORGANISM="Phaeocystis Sp, Strain CCMP2710" /LENGTH=47 /DNA_ID= /DNA_START= /DNA_END= /DNA_ORIENTATION=
MSSGVSGHGLGARAAVAEGRHPADGVAAAAAMGVAEASASASASAAA